MTAKEVKKYFKQVETLDRRAMLTIEKIKKLRSKLDYRSPTLDGSGGSISTGDRMADVITLIVEYEERAIQQLQDYIVMYRKIEDLIGSVEDHTQREILERKYLLYEPWDDIRDEDTGELLRRGIIEQMGYSRRRVFQLHCEALKKIALNCIEFHQ